MTIDHSFHFFFSESYDKYSSIKSEATTTYILPNKYFLQTNIASKPIIAVGTKAIATLNISLKFLNTFWRYIKTTRMAPSWIMISKLFVNESVLIFQIWLTKIICPVDETGKNSVIPSIIPSKKSVKNVHRYILQHISPIIQKHRNRWDYKSNKRPPNTSVV